MADSIGTLVWRFAQELVKHAGDGFKHVPISAYRERLKLCHECPSFMNEIQRCAACGCHMPTKAKWRSSSCPLPEPRWERIRDEDGEEKNAQ
jgi:anaerobic ribonucleoside-triphosphate reductase